MEKEIRKVLYSRSGLDEHVLYNPTRKPSKEMERPLIVDVTKDISNSTVVYHKNTKAVQALLNDADLIVADSARLLTLFKGFFSHFKVVAPYASGQAVDTPNEDGLKVGLLNHSTDVSMANMHHKKLLSALDEEFLFFGKGVDGLQGEVIEGLDEFAGRCDILLLPSLPNRINSVTIPLCVMRAGTVVIARNSAGYYELSSATGVLLLDSDHSGDWGKRIDDARRSPKLMEQYKLFNQKYAKSISDDSMKRLNMLSSRLADLNK